MKPSSFAAMAVCVTLMAGLLGGCSQIRQATSGQVQKVILPAPSADSSAGSGATVASASSAAAEGRLRIRIPARQADAPVRLVARNGEVETYMAADDISVSYRRGVLVATRGLGADLMAGDASATLGALQMPGEGAYARQMRYLTGNHQSTWIQAGCEMKTAGADVRGGRTLARYEESCIARRDRFTNLYWLDGAGQITASRQWVSAAVGYLESSPVPR